MEYCAHSTDVTTPEGVPDLTCAEALTWLLTFVGQFTPRESGGEVWVHSNGGDDLVALMASAKRCIAASWRSLSQDGKDRRTAMREQEADVRVQRALRYLQSIKPHASGEEAATVEKTERLLTGSDAHTFAGLPARILSGQIGQLLQRGVPEESIISFLASGKKWSSKKAMIAEAVAIVSAYYRELPGRTVSAADNVAADNVDVNGALEVAAARAVFIVAAGKGLYKNNLAVFTTEEAAVDAATAYNEARIGEYNIEPRVWMRCFGADVQIVPLDTLSPDALVRADGTMKPSADDPDGPDDEVAPDAGTVRALLDDEDDEAIDWSRGRRPACGNAEGKKPVHLPWEDEDDVSTRGGTR